MSDWEYYENPDQWQKRVNGLTLVVFRDTRAASRWVWEVWQTSPNPWRVGWGFTDMLARSQEAADKRALEEPGNPVGEPVRGRKRARGTTTHPPTPNPAFSDSRE